MEVALTPRAEELLRQLVRLGLPERIVELALERLIADRRLAVERMTPQEAVDRIRKLRERNTLGGVSVDELINEDRKY